jgi:hypothetical protein
MAQDGDEPTKEEVWVWATKVQQKQDETQVLKLLQAGVKSNSCKKEMMNCQIRRVLAIKKKRVKKNYFINYYSSQNVEKIAI